MNSKILTALALLAATPAFAAGICIVCPPGYDCSGNKPVAHTGNAKLATIGDIPTTAAQVGAVPTTRKIAGLEMSGDITLEQLRDVLDTCSLPISGIDIGGTIESRCSDVGGITNTVGDPGSATSGGYCWCRYRRDDLKKILSGEACSPSTRYSSWVFDFNYANEGNTSSASTYCEYYCAKDCSNTCINTCGGNTKWRAAATWN